MQSWFRIYDLVDNQILVSCWSQVAYCVVTMNLPACCVLHNPIWEQIHTTYSGADPGFPVGGGTNPPGGANIRFWQFFWKLHEIEKILGRREGRVPGAPPGSATGTSVIS